MDEPLKIPEHLVREEIYKLFDEYRSTDSLKRRLEIYVLIPAIFKLITPLPVQEIKITYAKAFVYPIRDVLSLFAGRWPSYPEEVSRAAQWLLVHLPAGSLPDETIECFRKQYIQPQTG